MEKKEPRVCPKCGYEYEAWVEACPDCGVPLVAGDEETRHGRPTLEPGDDPQWTVVTNVPNAIIGSLIKSQLEDAGIPVLMYRSRSADVGEFSHNDYVPQDLRVPKNRWDEARAIIDGRPDLPPSFSGGPGYVGISNPYLPDGWSIVPGRSSPGPGIAGNDPEIPEAERTGWRVYKVDAEGAEYTRSDDYESRDLVPFDRSEDQYGEYDGDGYANEPLATQRWVKLFYAILLFAISLPFLLQLFAQLARIFEP
jgi:hypothetical protein